MITQPSCLPFSTEHLLKGACQEAFNAVITFLETNKTIKDVYISGYWAYLMTGEFGETGPNWHRAKAFDQKRSQSFLKNGQHFMQKIIAAQKRIIFLKDTPDLGFNIHNCFNLRPVRFHKINKKCGISLSKYQQRMLPYNKVLDQLLQNFPQILVYDPLPLLCQKNTCTARDNHLPYYFNGDHLNYYGANKVIHDLRLKTQGRLVG